MSHAIIVVVYSRAPSPTVHTQLCKSEAWLSGDLGFPASSAFRAACRLEDVEDLRTSTYMTAPRNTAKWLLGSRCAASLGDRSVCFRKGRPDRPGRGQGVMDRNRLAANPPQRWSLRRLASRGPRAGSKGAQKTRPGCQWALTCSFHFPLAQAEGFRVRQVVHESREVK